MKNHYKSKSSLKLGLWGIWALHTQFLLLIPFFAFMPRGSWWDGVAFVIALFLFGANLAINYVIAVFGVFRSEDVFSEHIALIAIWAVLSFASIKLADNLALYFHYQMADIKKINLSHSTLENGSFFKLYDAKLLKEFAYETTFSFAITAKGQSSRYEKVNYKTTPIVAENWKNETIFVFAVYNAKENKKVDFDIDALWHIPRSSEYVEKYPKLVEAFVQKYQFAKAETVFFLEQIDLQQKIEEEQTFSKWFYGIVMGLWLVAVAYVWWKEI